MKISLIQFCLGVLVLSLFPISEAFANEWYDADWTFSKKIIINGTTVDGTHLNFPMLINITDANLLASANNDGTDIVFTDLNNVTKLAHEIDFYDNTSGYLAAWIKIPILTGNDQTIMMYYNDTGSNGNQNNTNAVWTDYEAVWHFSTSGTVKDSTANGNDGIITGATFTTNCIIGNCLSFDGINDYVTFPHTDSLSLNYTDPRTIQAIHQIENGDGTMRWWEKFDNIDSNGTRYYLVEATEAYVSQIGTSFDAGFKNYFWGADPVSCCILGTQTWRHIASTYDGSGQLNIPAIPDQPYDFVINGTQHTDLSTTAGAMEGTEENTMEFQLGGQGTSASYGGLMDEVRMTELERSVIWLANEYQNTQAHTKNYWYKEFGIQGTNPSSEIYDTIYLRIADQFRNHIGVITNTDTTTDLDQGSIVVTVPFSTGIVQYMDTSFQQSGEGIACLYDGRVKVTSSLLITNDGAIRSNSFFEVLIDGVPQNIIGASGYNRQAAQDHSSLHVTAIGDCTVNDVITVTTLQEGAASITTMATSGSSVLMVERLGDGGGSGSSSSSAGGGGHTIQDEGNSLTARTILDFVGAGVTATDSGGKTVVTIPTSGNHSANKIQDDNTFVRAESYGNTGEIVFEVDGIQMINMTDVRTFYTQPIDMSGQNLYAGGGSDVFFFFANNDDVHLRMVKAETQEQLDYIFFNDQRLNDNSNLALYKWNSRDQGDVLTTFAQLNVQVENGTDGDEAASISMFVTGDGVNTSMLSLVAAPAEVDNYVGATNGNRIVSITNVNRTVIDSDLIIGANKHTPEDCDGCLVLVNANPAIDNSPSSLIVDAVTLWADNGTAELYVMDEAGNENLLSPHNFDHVERKASMDWVTLIENRYIGKGVSVSWFEVIRALEEVTGKTLLREYDLPQSELLDWNTDQQKRKASEDKFRQDIINKIQSFQNKIDFLLAKDKLNEDEQIDLSNYQGEINNLIVPDRYKIEPRPTYFNMIEDRN